MNKFNATVLSFLRDAQLTSSYESFLYVFTYPTWETVANLCKFFPLHDFGICDE
jgi:hypothetical protein